MQSGLTSSGTGLAGGDPDFRQYSFRMTSWNLSSPSLKEGLVQSPGISVLTDLKSYYFYYLVGNNLIRGLDQTQDNRLLYHMLHWSPQKHSPACNWVSAGESGDWSEGECWRSLPGNYGHWADQNGNAAGLCKQEQQWACPDLNKLQQHGQVNWRGWIQLLDRK